MNSIIPATLKRPKKQHQPRKISKDEKGVVDNIDNVAIENSEKRQILLQKKNEIVEIEAEFTTGTTNRGTICIWSHGYRFVKNRGPYWRCSERGCPATALANESDVCSIDISCSSNACSLENDGKISGKMRGEHIHPPHPELRQAEEKRLELKNRVRIDPNVDLDSLIASVRFGIGDEAFMAMGTDKSLKSLLLRERKKLLGKVDAPDVMAVEIPTSLTEKDGYNILVYDSRIDRPDDQQQVVLVFGHPIMLQQLALQTVWAIYGMSRAAPKNFSECLVIGAFVREQFFVAAQALLTGKTLFHYEEALEALAVAIMPATPQRIYTDLDDEIALAAQKIFPESMCGSNYFHWAQSVYVKWREMDLDVFCRLEDNAEGKAARRTFRRLLCLPLIPVTFVNRGFFVIAEAAPTSLEEFLFFFKSTYIGLTAEEVYWKMDEFGAHIEEEAGEVVEQEKEGEENVQMPQTSSMMMEQQTLPEHTNSADAGVPCQVVVDASPHNSLPHQTPQTSSSMDGANDLSSAICQEPIYPVPFWNIYNELAATLSKTNSITECVTSHFTSCSNIPSLSSFLVAFWDDVEKQCDKARISMASKNKRQSKYAIRDEPIVNILREAEYDSDESLFDTLDLLSRHLQIFVSTLRYDVRTLQESEDTLSTPPPLNFYGTGSGNKKKMKIEKSENKTNQTPSFVNNLRYNVGGEFQESEDTSTPPLMNSPGGGGVKRKKTMKKKVEYSRLSI